MDFCRFVATPAILSGSLPSAASGADFAPAVAPAEWPRQRPFFLMKYFPMRLYLW
jgi:hypothetical protein